MLNLKIKGRMATTEAPAAVAEIPQVAAVLVAVHVAADAVDVVVGIKFQSNEKNNCSYSRGFDQPDLAFHQPSYPESGFRERSRLSEVLPDASFKLLCLNFYIKFF